MNPMELLELVEKEVFSNIMHIDHPRFFAFVPGPLLTGTLLLSFPLTVTVWVAIVLIILSALFIFPLLSGYDQLRK